MNSNDGSTLGISAERAIETILGGKESPEKEEQASREDVRRRLGNAPRLADLTMRIEEREEDMGELHFKGPVEVLYWHGKEFDLTYGLTADIAARAILDFIETYPEFADATGENEYAKDADWKAVTGPENMPKPVRLGLYEHMKDNGYSLGLLGLTGFQWGFAYNTARWLRFEEPEGNPAIVEIGETA